MTPYIQINLAYIFKDSSVPMGSVSICHPSKVTNHVIHCEIPCPSYPSFLSGWKCAYCVGFSNFPKPRRTFLSLLSWYYLYIS